jgi:uncharacterized protein YeaO (DUF488 family)
VQIWTRRIYEPPSGRDGRRVLVDRIWPRGVSKEDARLDDWLRDVAPSDELRHWFGHDPARWDGFRERYFAELDAHPDAVRPLQEAARDGRLTLLYGARDTDHNNAVALRDYLRKDGDS